MRKILIPVIAAMALLLMPVASETAGPERADTYDQVWCIDPAGDTVQAKAIDANAIEQGGKAHAIDLFHANHPDWFCWWEWREPASS